MVIILSLLIGLVIGCVLGTLFGLILAFYSVKQGWVKQDGYYYDGEVR